MSFELDFGSDFESDFGSNFELNFGSNFDGFDLRPNLESLSETQARVERNFGFGFELESLGGELSQFGADVADLRLKLSKMKISSLILTDSRTSVFQSDHGYARGFGSGLAQDQAPFGFSLPIETKKSMMRRKSMTKKMRSKKKLDL